MIKNANRTEIEANYDFFQRSLAGLIASHRGKYALLKSRAVVGFYEDPFEADKAGEAKFPNQLYSIQQVTAEPVELGIYANVPG